MVGVTTTGKTVVTVVKNGSLRKHEVHCCRLKDSQSQPTVLYRGQWGRMKKKSANICKNTYRRRQNKSATTSFIFSVPSPSWYVWPSCVAQSVHPVIPVYQSARLFCPSGIDLSFHYWGIHVLGLPKPSLTFASAFCSSKWQFRGCTGP